MKIFSQLTGLMKPESVIPPDTDDADAPMYADPHACIIYAAVSGFRQAIEFDGERLGRPLRPGARVCYRLRVRPGRHRISRAGAGRAEFEPDEIAFSCPAGSVRFFEVGAPDIEASPCLRMLGQERGRRTITGRTLFIDRHEGAAAT